MLRSSRSEVRNGKRTAGSSLVLEAPESVRLCFLSFMGPRAQHELPERDTDCGERLLAGLEPEIEGALSLVLGRGRVVAANPTRVPGSFCSIFQKSADFRYFRTRAAKTMRMRKLLLNGLLASKRHVHKTQSLKVTVNICFQSVAYLTYNSTSSTAMLSYRMPSYRHILSSRSSLVVWLRVLVKYGGLWKEQHVLVE